MIRITPKTHIRGEVLIPGDKSISHRAVMLGALAKGCTRITHFLQGADCLSTIACFLAMGVEIENLPGEVLVHGKGLYGLTSPKQALDVGNSGTTARLMSGILSGQSFSCTVTGDDSIRSRPMGRIITPLTAMGASIESEKDNSCAPLRIFGRPLHGISYTSPVASAQVKSSILLAGLYADGKTSVTEPYLSRNHTELMLSHFGASITSKDTTASILPQPELTAREIAVPGDISSAAYFIAAGLLVPHSEILLRHVGINPTRDGMLRVCRAMGANITLLNQSYAGGEPTADILVQTSSLTGTTIGGELIPTLIDELPILAVMAAFAQGETVIKDAEELKVKESNRIDAIVQNLSAMGADITATEDGMIIQGGRPLHSAVIQTKLDHRIAMSFAIAGLAAFGETTLVHGECVDISYPGFYQVLEGL